MRIRRADVDAFARVFVAGALGLVLLLAGGSLALVRSNAPDPAAGLALDTRVAREWAEREAALRQRLQAAPRDDRARLQLTALLTAEALYGAQESCAALAADPSAGVAGSDAYKEQVVVALTLSPQLAEARQLAERVAKQSRDRRHRAAAWARLARIHGLLGSRDAWLACRKAAVREDSSYRLPLDLPKE